MLLPIKKQTDAKIEQRKTKTQETLDFKMRKQMKTYPFSPPKYLVEEATRLLTGISFEEINSVFLKLLTIIVFHFQNQVIGLTP